MRALGSQAFLHRGFGRDKRREVPGAVDDERLLAPKTEGRLPARFST
jgi:hypothetical protein